MWKLVMHCYPRRYPANVDHLKLVCCQLLVDHLTGRVSCELCRMWHPNASNNLKYTPSWTCGDIKAGIYIFELYMWSLYTIYNIVNHITYNPRCYVHHVNPHVACLLALTGLATGSYSQGRGQEAKHDGWEGSRREEGASWRSITLIPT